nr:acetyl-coenzyme A transporter 1-like [Leptinotarsa decemlineata]
MNVTERRKNKNVDNISSKMENGELPQILPEGKLRGDGKNILLLFFLYTLQGIPLGLSSAIPMILQNRGVSYKQQAEFSFVFWPFSLKLLWAPLVDSLFSSRIGRRKTWLIPTQYLIGGFMLLLSSHVNKWLGDDGNQPNTEILTVLFFALNFLAATQDIAVDGWALTMLKKTNVGHASTCNSVGQTTGYFLSYVVFMALESSTFFFRNGSQILITKG